VLIERDPEKAQHASDLLDCLVINEPGNNTGTLKKAGIDRADYFVSVTESDEVNIIASGMAASEFGVPHKIARIRNVDYSDSRILKPPFLGIDYIVNPDQEVARSILDAIERGAVSDVMFFERTGMQMRSVTVGGEFGFTGKTIQETRDAFEVNFLVAVILRGNSYLVPSGTTRIHEGDKLYMIASEQDFEQIFATLGRNRAELNRIVILGAGRIGQTVVDQLVRVETRQPSFFRRVLSSLRVSERRKLTVIDNDPAQCRVIADRYPNVLVLNADISDEKFAEEEQFANTDLLVSTTSNQELNMVTGIYAKKLGTRRAVALVNKSYYVHVASSLGIDVAINPVDSMVSTIMGYISRGNVRRVHRISGSTIEVIEMSVDPASRAAGRRLRDMKFPKNALVLAATRDDKNIIPDGDFTLRQGDNLIVIAQRESVPRLEAMFTE
jgi:trk system potassium uptake protein TrkA